MIDEGALVVLCSVPTLGGHAERIAQWLLEAGVAACVNLVGPVRSLYRWQGALKDDSEIQLVIKTCVGRYAELESILLREHPYEVPEILALPVTQGSSRYLEWLETQTRPDEVP